MVSGGDPGVFGMARRSAKLSSRDRRCGAASMYRRTGCQCHVGRCPPALELHSVTTSCVLSLSDNLKPWPVIEQRLEACGIWIRDCPLNPVSRARPWQLERAFEKLRATLPRPHCGDLRPCGRKIRRACSIITTLFFGRAFQRRHGHLRHHRIGANEGDRAPWSGSACLHARGTSSPSA